MSGGSMGGTNPFQIEGALKLYLKMKMENEDT